MYKISDAIAQSQLKVAHFYTAQMKIQSKSGQQGLMSAFVTLVS